MSLAAYLAKNYLTTDPPPKKKKRKRTENLQVIDDTPASLPPSRATANPNDNEDLTDAQIVGNIVDESRQPAGNRWKRAVKLEDDDLKPEDPTKLEGDEERGGIVSGARAGLQTAAQIKASIEEKQRQEREDWAHHHMTGREHETVYRDATGRRVDVIFKRAELRAAADRAKREQEEKNEEEKKQRELRGGLAQKRAQEAEKERMKMDTSSFSRTVEDVEWNEELKAHERWDDPAAAFLKKNDSDGGVKFGARGKGRRFKRSVPVYTGAVPPNRFGIRPGYRWDGVDRSNGFEKTWFRKQNERRAEKEEWERWEAGADD
jgi:pre-mRNA-splicing factor CWC26